MRRGALKLYTIHLPPPYSAAGAEPEAVREGFSLGAFLFSVIWALGLRLWIFAGTLFALFVAVLVIGYLAGLNDAGRAVLALAVMAWAGMEGNDRLRGGLAARGWREIGVIAAESADAALRRFGDLSAIGPLPAAPAPGGPAAA